MEYTLCTWKNAREMLEVLSTWMSGRSYMCMDASKLQYQCTNTPSTNIIPPQPSTDLLLFPIHHLLLTQNIDVGKAG